MLAPHSSASSTASSVPADPCAGRPAWLWLGISALQNSGFHSFQASLSRHTDSYTTKWIAHLLPICASSVSRRSGVRMHRGPALLQSIANHQRGDPKAVARVDFSRRPAYISQPHHMQRCAGFGAAVVYARRIAGDAGEEQSRGSGIIPALLLQDGSDCLE